MRTGRRSMPVAVMLLALGVAPAKASEPARPSALDRRLPVRADGRPAMVTSRLLQETVSAALRAAGNAETRLALASMAARARSSALLPELWLRAARSTDDSLRLAPTVDDPNHYTALGGAGTWLEARLAWHFDRLVFDRDEIAVSRLAREHTEAMARLVGRVTSVLFAWQRAVLRAEDPKASDEDLEQALLARAEAEATLDLLTAGWFGARVLAPATAPAAGAPPRRE